MNLDNNSIKNLSTFYPISKLEATVLCGFPQIYLLDYPGGPHLWTTQMNSDSARKYKGKPFTPVFPPADEQSEVVKIQIGV